MKKRLLSTLLALCIVLALLPGTVWAENAIPASGTCGDNITWNFDANSGVLTISGTGPMTDFLYSGPWSFSGYIIKTIIIKEGVTSIGKNAFPSIYSLESIIIPNSVSTIGNGAFAACTGLASVTIPNGITSINDGVFATCSSLTTIDIPDSVTSIGSGAFVGCSSLTSVTIPNSVTSIGHNAFTGCSGLTSITIPNGVTDIGELAFSGCNNLTTILVEPQNQNFLFEDGVLFNSEKTKLLCCLTSKDGAYDIPNSITTIGEGAFENCSSLTSVTIPAGITSVPYRSFACCSSLTNVTISKNVANIGHQAFVDCDGLKDIYYNGSKSEWDTIDIGDLNDSFQNATVHYNSTGPDGQGGTGEDPKPDPNPDQPIIPDYIDEHIKNYSLKFHLGTAGEVNMDLQWGWSLFGAASNSYNIPLSAAAMMLSASAEHSEDEVKSLLNSLGFKTTDSKNYGHSWMEVDHPGVAFGYQEVNGKHIFAIIIRGTNSNEVENFISDALGFVPSANNLRLQWESFVKDTCKLDLAEIRGSSRFLVTGHSLGGATANVLAKNLSDTYGRQNVYAYAFAPPKPVDFVTGAITAGAYDNIFNVVNVEDGVTYLPPDGFLFTRYGRDIPFHKDRNDGFYAKFKELAGRDFNKGFLGFGSDSAHDTAVYMAYVLTGQLSDTIRVIKCACPVDLEIYDAAGILVGQVQNNVASDTESEKVYIRVIGDEKYIYVLVDGDYTIKMTGTDKGAMTYSVQDVNGGGEIVAEKVYQNVNLESGKLLNSTVADISVTNPSNVPLYVVDENGKPEKEVLPDGKGTEVPIDTPITPDNTHVITFNPNGGTVTPTSLTTNDDGKLTSLPTPTRSGYTFSGWFTASSGGVAVTSDTKFTESVTVYAHWTYVTTDRPSGDASPSYDDYTPPAYSVAAPSVVGGSVSISPKSASKGSTVTLTVKPDNGYELVSLTATDKNGKTLALSDKGNGKYTFTMPSGKVTVDAVFQLIQPNEPEPGTPWNNPFTDISESAWYYDAVKFVSENSLMNGYGNGIFAPDAYLSRSMLAQILYNREGRPAVSENNAFADVASDAWYSEAVAWAAARGIVSGYGNGLFGPSDHITREQLAVMLWRYAGEPAATNKELHFNEVDEVSAYALDALCWATENGIINGKGGGILDPRGQATRAQVAQMLMNYLKK